MFGGPEVSYHQTHSARDWLSILRSPYQTQNLQRSNCNSEDGTGQMAQPWMFMMMMMMIFFLVQGHYGITLRRYLYKVVPGWRSRYTERYGLEGPGFETPVVARDSSLLHISTYRPWGPPSSFAMGAGHGLVHAPLSRVQSYLCNRSSSRCSKWGDLQSIHFYSKTN